MMNRRNFNLLFGAVALTPLLARMSLPSAHAALTGENLYVGYGAEICRVAFNSDGIAIDPPAAHAAAEIQEVWPAPSGVLYVGSSDKNTSKDPVKKHYLEAFAADSAGALRHLGAPVALRERPIFVTTDGESRYVLSAHIDPSSVSVHPINPDGSIGAEIAQRDPRLATDLYAYPHQVRVMPSNRTVMLVCRGNEAEEGKPEDPGALMLFDFANSQLTPKQVVAPNGGFSNRVRHVAFHPSGKWVYVVLEAQNAVHTYAINADDTLSAAPLFTASTLANPKSKGNIASAIQINPEGTALYVANRGRGIEMDGNKRIVDGSENTVAAFRIDRTTGEPVRVQIADPGTTEIRTMAIFDGGRRLAAESERTNYRRVGGVLEPIPSALTIFDASPDGTLTLASKLEVDTSKAKLFWVGAVRS